MAWAVVQNSNSASGTSPATATFTSTPTQGNLLLVSTQTASTAPTIKDGNGNPFTLLASVTNGSHSGYIYAMIATASQSPSITVTAGSTTTTVNIYELSGNPATLTGIVDVSSSFVEASTTTTTNGNQPSITTTNANDLLWTSLFMTGTISAPSVSQGTLEQASPASITTVDAQQALSATGTYTPYFSWTATHSWSQITLALSATSGPPPVGNLVDITQDFQGLGYSGSQRKLAHNSLGRLFAAYRKEDAANGNTYEPYVAHSDDGVTWTRVEVAVITTDHQRVPSIFIDGNDIVHCVWYGKDPNNTGTDERQIKYSKSTDKGVTWSAWVSVGGDVTGYTSSTLWQEHPTIIPDPANVNTLYVVWEGRDSTFPTSQQIKFSKSTDGGSTWAAWQNIFTSSSYSSSRPDICITTDGLIHVFFYSQVGTTGNAEQILHISSATGGSTWSSATIVSGDNGFDSRQSSCVTDGVNIHVVWRAENGTYATTQIIYAMWNGATWSTPITIGPSSGNYQFFSQIALVGGLPTVVWFQTPNASSYPSEAPTDGTVYWSQKASGGWTPAVALTDTTYDMYANIDRTMARIIYSTNASSPFDIQYLNFAPTPSTSGGSFFDF